MTPRRGTATTLGAATALSGIVGVTSFVFAGSEWVRAGITLLAFAVSLAGARYWRVVEPRAHRAGRWVTTSRSAMTVILLVAVVGGAFVFVGVHGVRGLAESTSQERNKSSSDPVPSSPSPSGAKPLAKPSGFVEPSAAGTGTQDVTVGGVHLTLAVANATEGEVKWRRSTAASYDQVVDAQLVYDDTGARTSDVTAQLEYGREAGSQQFVGWRVSVANRIAELRARISLDRSDASLAYIPGKAVWRHAPETGGADRPSNRLVDTALPDQVVLSPAEPLTTVQKRYNNAGSIVVQFRVLVSGTEIDLVGTNRENGARGNTIYVRPGASVPVDVDLRNTGNTTHYGSSITVYLPPGLHFSSRRTRSTIGSYTLGGRRRSLSLDFDWRKSSVTAGVGTLPPGGEVIIQLTARERSPDRSPSIVRAETVSSAAGHSVFYNVLDIYVD